MRKDTFSVEVIGFNQTERIVLSSIFGLSARRQPKFLQHSSVAYAPDVFLVDAGDEQAVALFRERNAMRRVPAIFIGDSDHDTGYPLLARPLQWTRLFKAFDLAVADQPAESGDYETTLPNAIISASLTPAGVPPVAAPALIATSAAATPTTSQALPAQETKPAHPPLASAFAAARAAMQGLSIGKPAALNPAAAPVPVASPIATSLASSAPAAPVAPVPATESARSEGEWVLVVDDNLTVREFMKNKLAPFNMNVDYAESGEQAVGLTGKRRYTCIFLDVVMPGIDGYQVCKLIKSRKATDTPGKTAVVMLTSKGSPFDKIRGAMAGCDAYLTKPVDEEKLLATIVKFLPKMA